MSLPRNFAFFANIIFGAQILFTDWYYFRTNSSQAFVDTLYKTAKNSLFDHAENPEFAYKVILLPGH